MSADSPDHIITGPEAEAQLRFVRRVILATSDEEKQAALDEGLLTFGVRFFELWRLMSTEAGSPANFEDTGQQLIMRLASWLTGARLSQRADEDERRALAALQVLESDSGLMPLTNFAAEAVLALPESHPLRDVDKVRSAVRAQLTELQAGGEDISWVFAARGLALAFRERFGTDEELIAWEPWAETVAAHIDPDDTERLWGQIEEFYIDLTKSEGPQWREHAARARQRLDQLALSDNKQSMRDLRRSVGAIADDDQLKAADHFKQALESGSFTPAVERMMAVKEARVRLAYGQHDRVITLLESRLDQYEEDYVTAIHDADRNEKGDQFNEACTNLAFALAAVGRWEPAIEALERGKCAKQRYTRALRRTPKASELLGLESDLYAISRGLAPDRALNTVPRVQDWLSKGLSPEAELQEQYRQVIPEIAPSDWQAPRLADIRRSLNDGEAALSLGLSWPGLLGALVVRNRDTLLHTILNAEVTEERLADVLIGPTEQGEDGFLIALERGTDETAARCGLERLLEYLDEVLGRPIADVLGRHGLRRLVVIPHRFLRLTPLWALPSWVELEIRMEPAAASLTFGDIVPAMSRKALVVTNPTLDLPMASTEGAITVARLGEAAFDVRSLNGTEASEDAVGNQLNGVGLLHFAGHGHASLTDGSLSALLVSPDWSRAGMASADALVTMANAAPDTKHLVLDQDEGEPRRKMYYEYAKAGTLFVDAMNDDVAVAGELWRAGDILVQGSLEGCALAFLCACSSGMGAIPALDEGTGLPAALDLAGVRSVVSTGWPVADTLAVLFADEFYARALPGHGGAIDVLAAVRGAAAALRTMERNEAADRVEHLVARAADAAARFRMRSFAKRLRTGAERPFAHPFDWGAFFVTGAATVPLSPP